MATALRQKIAYFKAATQTKKQIFLTLISPFPLISNEHSVGLVDVSLTMDAFFEWNRKLGVFFEQIAGFLQN